MENSEFSVFAAIREWERQVQCVRSGRYVDIMDIFHSCSEFTLEIEWISFWSTHAVWDLCSFCVKCCLFEIEGEFGVFLCCQLSGSKKMFMIPHNWCIGHIWQNVKNCMSFMFFSVIDYGPLQNYQLVNFFAKTCNLYWFLISIWIFNFIQLSDSGWKGWNVGCWLMLVMMVVDGGAFEGLMAKTMK